MVGENSDIHPNALEFEVTQERYCSVNNVELYYECENTENPEAKKTAYLFLHGWTANRFRLHPLYILYMQEKYPIFRLDLRGHGWSQKHGIHDFKLTTMKEDLAAFINQIILQQFHFKKVVIIAHSMGGSITQLLALDHPSYLSKIVLLGSSSKWADSFKEKFRWVVYTWMYRLAHDKLYQNKKPGHIPWGLENFPMWDAKYLPPHKDLLTIRTATIQGLRELHRFNISKKLDKISIPVLILVGRDDTAAPVRYSETMHALIPDSTLVILENVNHDIAIGKPITAKKHIDIFLNGNN